MQSPEWIANARVLRRSGFGTTGRAVDAALSRGNIDSTVNFILNAKFEKDPGVLSTPMPDFRNPLPWKDLSDAERKKIQPKLQQRRTELTRWWLRRMVAAEHPVREKLTFIWHNHFATSVDVVRSAKLMAVQNATIRKHCLADFRVLAYSMLTDGAMLRWLNGTSNTAKSPNENLAREFIELFAIGHGNGYSEADVKEGARALTGWRLNEKETPQFDLDIHDSGPKTILGIKDNFDTKTFCDIVLQHPASSKFIATRLWRQLAADTPPTSATLERITAAYGAERDLKALTRSILTAPEFVEGTSTIVVGPLDWFIGLLRSLGITLGNASHNWEAVVTLRSLGQLPFHPPNVSGWPSGAAWLSTATFPLRIRAAATAVRRGDISLVEETARSDRIDAVGYFLGIGNWTDSSARALKEYLSDPIALTVAAANTPEYLTT